MSIHNQIPVDGYFLNWGMIITEMNIRVKFQASRAPPAVNRGERRAIINDYWINIQARPLLPAAAGSAVVWAMVKYVH